MRALTLAFAFLILAGPSAAQDAELRLPEYTDQQRWQRLALNLVWTQAALLELGKEKGMTPEEVGRWAGSFYARGWLGGQEAGSYAVAMNRNHMGWPGAAAEVLAASATTAEIRFNRPWESVIGPDRQIGGQTTAEFREMIRAVNEEISAWVGIDVAWEEGEDQDVLRLRTEYGPIQASNDIRWARGAFLSWNGVFTVLEMKKEAGMTAREIGLEAGELYGPGWTATTPWRLLRGMLWNAMGDPNTECEVLSASPAEVRATCDITYTAQRVRQGGTYFDVTLADVLENNRAFAESVAEQLGMRWEESWDDARRTIRVSKR